MLNTDLRLRVLGRGLGEHFAQNDWSPLNLLRALRSSRVAFSKTSNFVARVQLRCISRPREFSDTKFVIALGTAAANAEASERWLFLAVVACNDDELDAPGADDRGRRLLYAARAHTIVRPRTYLYRPVNRTPCIILVREFRAFNRRVIEKTACSWPYYFTMKQRDWPTLPIGPVFPSEILETLKHFEFQNKFDNFKLVTGFSFRPFDWTELQNINPLELNYKQLLFNSYK